MHIHRMAPLAGVCALALAVPAVAGAQGQNYPPPSNPGSVQKKPKGPFKTLRVGKGERYRTIQSAVNAAKPGDTIRIRNGTYRESVTVRGSGKRFVKLIGNVADPQKVVLEGGGTRQNGVTINGADAVTLRGIKARRYKANGFFAVNVTGYAMDRLIAELPGTYGLYAFNSKGGSMTNSISYLAADGGYYIGQTPKQTRPLRTTIRNVVAWGNVAGYTGTNSRYVTITRSTFMNNGIGLVPNSLDSEKFPPQETNVFTDNEVFWNNFDVYAKSAPFKANRSDDFAYPPGIGFIVLSGRDNVIERNRIYGNWLSGYIGVPNPFLKNPDDRPLQKVVVRNNQFGKDGADRNGRDLATTGTGSDNCFAGNTGVQTTVPNDPAMFPDCPFTGPNTENNELLGLMISWAVGPTEALKYRSEGWIQHPHAPNANGYEPLVDFQRGKKYGPTTL
jgi:hypothetical protein